MSTWPIQRSETGAGMTESESIYIDFYETSWGTGAVLFSEAGIKYLLLPTGDREVLEETLREEYGECGMIFSGGPARLKEGLLRYFRGEKVEFGRLGLGLDLSGFSDFEKKALGIASRIPYGSIWSYKQIAQEIGRPASCRAVGNVMAKNRVPILVPCHRVVRSDLRIGGFGAGPEWKRRLLELEGIAISSDGKCLLQKKNVCSAVF